MEDEEINKEVKLLGFPIEHKHKLCCLRQELIDSFVDSRYMMFIKYAAYHLQQLNQRKTEEKEKLNKVQNETDNKAIEENSKDEKTEKDDNNEKKNQIQDDEAKKIVESIRDGTKIECIGNFQIVYFIILITFCFIVEESTKNIVKTAAIAVGSLKETEFDIRFNPDVYSPGIRHCETLDPPIAKQRQLVKDAAEFLLTVQIPSFVSVIVFLYEFIV